LGLRWPESPVKTRVSREPEDQRRHTQVSTSQSSGAPAQAYTIEKQDLEVRLFGDTTVVTYVKIYRQSLDPQKFFHEDDTDVFTRDAGGWHLRFTKILPAPVQSAST